VFSFKTKIKQKKSSKMFAKVKLAESEVAAKSEDTTFSSSKVSKLINLVRRTQHNEKVFFPSIFLKTFSSAHQTLELLINLTNNSCPFERIKNSAQQQRQIAINSRVRIRQIYFPFIAAALTFLLSPHHPSHITLEKVSTKSDSLASLAHFKWTVKSVERIFCLLLLVVEEWKCI
jgi:hypothetical protein